MTGTPAGALACLWSDTALFGKPPTGRIVAGSARNHRTVRQF